MTMNQQDEYSITKSTLEKKTVEKILYRFDSNECGFIEITSNNIEIHFPEKCGDEKTFSNQEIQLFVNECLLFHSNWLPIYSASDYFKCKTMFFLSYQMYCNALQQLYYTPNVSDPYYSDEIVTHINNDTFSIYSFENPSLCSVEINVHKEDSDNEQTVPKFSLQIFIGSNLVVDTNREFKNCSSVHYILQFLLSKLSKY